MRLVSVAVATLALVLSAAESKDDQVANEMGMFSGAWEPVSIESEGKGPERPTGHTLTFEKSGKCTITLKAEERFPGATIRTVTFTFSVNPNETPKRIDLTNIRINGDPKLQLDDQKGIYKFEGDKLTICGGDGERPKEFSTKDKTSILTVYKRVKR